MIYIVHIILVIVSFLSFGWSQTLFPILGGQRAGTSVFTFLNIGVSARATGMGEAVVALNQDATSIHYNPAIVAQLDQTEISISQIQWPADIFYDYFSLSHRLKGRHYVGLNGGILHMKPMVETTEYFPDGTGNYFSYQDRFLGVTYGAKMTDRFSFGVTLKYVAEDLAEYKMNAMLMDVGTFYWTGYGSLRFCASLSNFGKQIAPKGDYMKKILDQNSGKEIEQKTDFEKFSPPTQFRVGAAVDPIMNKEHLFTISTQLNHPVDNAEYIVTGLEYSFMRMFFIRSGYKFNKNEENFTAGAGLFIPLGRFKLRVDYGYANFDHLTDPNRFSIGFSL
ncbi:MAG: PorV/PorQ family protein [Candidatus Neomarinimicrobiota bacterium]